MSLVAYGSSDESDSEETNSGTNGRKGLSENSIVSSTNDTSESNNKIQIKSSVKNENIVTETDLFSTLPSPKNTFSIPDNTFKLLNKKQPVKIVLPSLSEIKVDEDEMKKRKPSTKGSGLFALLPAPKNVSSLVPNVVKNKPLPPKIVPKTVPLKKPNISSVSNNKKLDDDEEDTEQPESFFFNSADVKPDEILPVDIPEISSKSMFDLTNSSTPTSSTNAVESFNPSVTVTPNEEISSSGYTFPDANNGLEVSDINDEAIEKLCGVGAKKRKGLPDEIIDINVDSIVGDAYMWLSKDLTVEQEHTSFKKPKNLSVVERRKHQITYLASQAKEKELELKNQWANNRMTRKQTQSKYGF